MCVVKTISIVSAAIIVLFSTAMSAIAQPDGPSLPRDPESSLGTMTRAELIHLLQHEPMPSARTKGFNGYNIEWMEDVTPQGAKDTTALQFKLYNVICGLTTLEFWVYDSAKGADAAFNKAFGDRQSTEGFEINDIEREGYAGYFIAYHTQYRDGWALTTLLVENVIIVATADKKNYAEDTHHLGCSIEVGEIGVEHLIDLANLD